MAQIIREYEDNPAAEHPAENPIDKKSNIK